MLYLKHIPGQTNKDWFTYSFPIGSAKINQVRFESDTPIVEYQQHYQNSCCFSGLYSDFKGSK